MVREFKLNKAQREQQQKALEREFLECVSKLDEAGKKKLLELMIGYVEYEKKCKCADDMKAEDRRKDFAIYLGRR